MTAQTSAPATLPGRASFRRFLRDESGATVIEYAGIAGAVALVLIAIMPSIGQAVADMLGAIQAGL